MRKALLALLVCSLITTESTLLYDKAQTVYSVIEYYACVEDFEIRIDVVKYSKIDNQKTSPDRDVLWRLPRGAEKPQENYYDFP